MNLHHSQQMTQGFVSVSLQGGLGNQLFQIFTGAAIAITTRRHLVCKHIDGNRRNYKIFVFETLSNDKVNGFSTSTFRHMEIYD